MRVSLEEMYVMSENEEQCLCLRELHLYLSKLCMLLISRKSWRFYCFLFALLGSRKKNDSELNGGEHFRSPNFS